ncbi:SdrD B-like domain-containing protein [Corynebacterium pygosceleis]|uniref:SdrD B-like domain-containing protein n=1 Tax=Corynebacterium pygosceleis TaxID=2800406 RepID=UPI002006AF8D|nr:SdrD B-like domain-containing protein [Corynebacterium pygosceleis]MCK7674939.1 hypothetical protein [Corynebacterium pygosceleis]
MNEKYNFNERLRCLGALLGTLLLMVTTVLLGGVPNAVAAEGDGDRVKVSGATIRFGSAGTVKTAQSLTWPVSVNCNSGESCDGLRIQLSLPQIPEGAVLEDSSNGLIRLERADTPNPVIVFDQLARGSAYAFDLRYAATKDPVWVPGDYSMGFTAKLGADEASGVAPAHVEGAPLTGFKKRVIGSPTVLPGQVLLFEFDYERRVQTGTTGLTGTIVDTLPEGLEFVRLVNTVCENGESVCGGRISASHISTSPNSVSVDVDRKLDAAVSGGQMRATVRYEARVADTATTGTQLTNSVGFSGTDLRTLDGRPATVDGVRIGGPAAVTVTVVEDEGQGGITKTLETAPAPGYFNTGQTITWLLQAETGAPGANVVVTDTLRPQSCRNWEGTTRSCRNGGPATSYTESFETIQYIVLDPVFDGRDPGNARMVQPKVNVTYIDDKGGEVLLRSISGDSEDKRYVPVPEGMNAKSVRIDYPELPGPNTVNIRVVTKLDTGSAPVGEKAGEYWDTANDAVIRINGTERGRSSATAPIGAVKARPRLTLTTKPSAFNQSTSVNLRIGDDGQAGQPFEPLVLLSFPPGVEWHPEKLETEDSRCSIDLDKIEATSVKTPNGGTLWKLTWPAEKNNGEEQWMTTSFTQCTFSAPMKRTDAPAGVYNNGDHTAQNSGVIGWIGTVNPDVRVDRNESTAPYCAFEDSDTCDPNVPRFGRKQASFTIGGFSEQVLDKYALGDLPGESRTTYRAGSQPAGFPTTSNSEDQVTFEIDYGSGGTIPLASAVLYDLLPANGQNPPDVTDIGGEADGLEEGRNNSMAPVLNGPVQLPDIEVYDKQTKKFITRPMQATVLYSEHGNPCRPEMSGAGAAFPTPECSTFNSKNQWKTAEELRAANSESPFSAVRALRIDIKDDLTKTYTIRYTMDLPAKNNDGEPLTPTDLAVNRVASRAVDAKQNDLGILGPSFARVQYVALPSISGTIFDDSDADGHFDGEDNDGPVLNETVTIELLDDNDVPVKETTTTDGTYRFNDVTPGTYRVRFTAPDGFVLSPQVNTTGEDIGQAGVADAGSEAGNPTATAVTPQFTVKRIGDIENVDAGVHPAGTVSANFGATLTGSYRNTYNWTVEKETSTAQLRAETGETVNPEFTVRLRADGSVLTPTETEFTGTVTLTNTSIREEEVGLELTGGHRDTCTLGETTVTVPESQGEDPGIRTVEVTCTGESIDALTDGKTTEVGIREGLEQLDLGLRVTTRRSAAADVALDPLKTETRHDESRDINPTATVKDVLTAAGEEEPVATTEELGGTFSYDEVRAQPDHTVAESYTAELVAPTEPGTCATYTNTATIFEGVAEHEMSAAADVEVCSGQPAEASVGVSASFDRVYGWNLEKRTVSTELRDPDETGARQPVLTYELETSATEPEQSDTVYEGQLEVRNTNDVDSGFNPRKVKVGVSSEKFGSCDVDPLERTIPSGQTESFNFTCPVPEGYTGDLKDKLNWNVTRPDGRMITEGSLDVQGEEHSFNRDVTVVDEITGNTFDYTWEKGKNVVETVVWNDHPAIAAGACEALTNTVHLRSAGSDVDLSEKSVTDELCNTELTVKEFIGAPIDSTDGSGDGQNTDQAVKVTPSAEDGSVPVTVTVNSNGAPVTGIVLTDRTIDFGDIPAGDNRSELADTATFTVTGEGDLYNSGDPFEVRRGDDNRFVMPDDLVLLPGQTLTGELTRTGVGAVSATEITVTGTPVDGTGDDGVLTASDPLFMTTTPTMRVEKFTGDWDEIRPGADAPAGDADDPDAPATWQAEGPYEITVAVINTGGESLGAITLDDVAENDRIDEARCAISPDGVMPDFGTANLTWVRTENNGQVRDGDRPVVIPAGEALVCRAEITPDTTGILDAEHLHSDTVTVTATGAESGQTVTAEDSFHAVIKRQSAPELDTRIFIGEATGETDGVGDGQSADTAVEIPNDGSTTATVTVTNNGTAPLGAVRITVSGTEGNTLELEGGTYRIDGEIRTVPSGEGMILRLTENGNVVLSDRSELPAIQLQPGQTVTVEEIPIPVLPAETVNEFTVEVKGTDAVTGEEITASDPLFVRTPAAVVDPTTSGSPTTSADPTSSGSPTSSAEPTSSGSPTSSAEPTSSGSPTSSAEPTSSGSPTSSAEPTSSGSPTSSAEPSTGSTSTTSTTQTPVPGTGSSGGLGIVSALIPFIGSGSAQGNAGQSIESGSSGASAHGSPIVEGEGQSPGGQTTEAAGGEESQSQGQDRDESLARTGANVLGLVLAGILAVLLGGILLMGMKRRM